MNISSLPMGEYQQQLEQLLQYVQPEEKDDLERRFREVAEAQNVEDLMGKGTIRRTILVNDGGRSPSLSSKHQPEPSNKTHAPRLGWAPVDSDATSGTADPVTSIKIPGYHARGAPLSYAHTTIYMTLSQSTASPEEPRTSDSAIRVN